MQEWAARTGRPVRELLLAKSRFSAPSASKEKTKCRLRMTTPLARSSSMRYSDGANPGQTRMSDVGGAAMRLGRLGRVSLSHFLLRKLQTLSSHVCCDLLDAAIFT